MWICGFVYVSVCIKDTCLSVRVIARTPARVCVRARMLNLYVGQYVRPYICSKNVRVTTSVHKCVCSRAQVLCLSSCER